MTDDCRHRDDAGPWVLGALDEEDARAFASHLEACPGCCSEVQELQIVADVLPMAAPQLVPPPDRKSTRLNSSHPSKSRMPSSA